METPSYYLKPLIFTSNYVRPDSPSLQDYVGSSLRAQSQSFSTPFINTFETYFLRSFIRNPSFIKYKTLSQNYVAFKEFGSLHSSHLTLSPARDRGWQMRWKIPCATICNHPMFQNCLNYFHNFYPFKNFPHISLCSSITCFPLLD